MNLIYLFASSTTDLQAYTSSKSGSGLPGKHAPWTLTRTIMPNEALPHRMDRAAAESAIERDGCQLWRFKEKKRVAKPALTITHFTGRERL